LTLSRTISGIADPGCYQTSRAKSRRNRESRSLWTLGCDSSRPPSSNLFAGGAMPLLWAATFSGRGKGTQAAPTLARRARAPLLMRLWWSEVPGARGLEAVLLRVQQEGAIYPARSVPVLQP
jgi:hypothetical protein